MADKFEKRLDILKEINDELQKQNEAEGKIDSTYEDRVEILNDIASSQNDLGGLADIQARQQKKINDLNKSGHTAIAKHYQKSLDSSNKLLKEQMKKLQAEKLSKQASEGLDKITGGMSSKVKDTVGGFKGMSKGAIASSLSMGLVVGAVVLLGKALAYASGIIDQLGGKFGVMGAQSGIFRDNMMTANSDAIQLGFSIDDAMNAVGELSANFGVGVDLASELPGQILDTGKAIGLSEAEATKLFGTLMSIGNLTADQAEHLAESTYQLAQQNNVNPVAVMRDIADSSETIAKFGASNLQSITKAAVQARKLGLSLSTVDKISDSLLDFQSSLTAEIEASVMTGKQLNLQKARELALTGDLSGMMDNVLEQVGGEAEFNKLNVLERKSLAKALGVEVAEMEKLVSAGGEQVEQQKAFKDLLGSDAMSALTSLTNKIKSIGADILGKIGTPLNDALKDFENKFITEENIQKVKDFSRNLLPFIQNAIEGIKSFASGVGNIIKALQQVATVLRAIQAITTLGLSEGDFLGLKAMGLRQADDFRSSGGSHLVVTPSGQMLQTNPKDTIMGSTKVNDFVSGPEGSMPLGGTNVDMTSTNQKLDRLNSNIETLVNITRSNPDKIVTGIGAL